MWFIGVELEQETSAPPPKKIPDPPLNPECQGKQAPSSTLNALYTYFNVICAVQIMSGTLPDTYINA